MLNYFNFEKFQDKYLITNDGGFYEFLTEKEFVDFTADNINVDSDLYQRLKSKFFCYQNPKQQFIDDFSVKVRKYKGYVFSPATLHIFVLTKRCNQKCIYCQASTCNDYSTEMNEETAKAAVDIALQSPSSEMSFEFQGGEPLLNFKVLRFIVEYTEEKKKDKRINYSIATNLLSLSEEILEFMNQHKIAISTSLDGNSEVHNKNRPVPGGNAFNLLKKQLEQLSKNGIPFSVIETTTKYSLPYYHEIIDQYVSEGIHNIFIRPLTILGYAKDNWGTIGYTSGEFLYFYEKIIDEIINCNLNGYSITEGHAVIFLKKILNQESMNYMELRSPCGGANGQLAYNYDGDVYTCDEARMLSEMGDKNFRLGNVFTDTFSSLMKKPVCSLIRKSSFLESLPACAHCVYSPYCGVCPVANWAESHTLYPTIQDNYRCEIYKGIQNILFNKLYEGNAEVFAVLKNMAGGKW